MATIQQVAKWAGVSLEQGSVIDKEISIQHILEVCTFMKDWETVASHLGLDSVALQEIKDDHSTTKKRKEMMLRAWKSERARGATYRRLGEVFLKLANAEDATKVFELAKTAEPPASIQAMAVATSTSASFTPSSPNVGGEFLTDQEEKILDDCAKRVIKDCHVQLDSSPLDQKLHFPYVRSALIEVADKWKHIGSVLGLTAAELRTIENENKRRVDQCLNDMISKWFQKSSSTNPATLRQLVGAIATQAGGKNPAHAESVSKRFQGSLDDVPFANKVDSTEISVANKIEVEAALGDVETKWKEIGIFLGLEMRKLNGLDEMSEMVEMWLSKRYDVKHFGNPSWQKLVSAVGSKAGAGDVAAAEDIASKHIDSSSQHSDVLTVTAKSSRVAVKVKEEADHIVVRTDGLNGITEDFDAYRMNASGRHGVALVISNTKFSKDSGLENLEEKDKELLVKAFKHLSYETVLLENLTEREIKNAVQLVMGKDVPRVGELAKFSACVSQGDDSFILAISSHGKIGGVLCGVEGGGLKEEDVIQEMNCPLLTEKPKILFIQACRGIEGSALVKFDDGSKASTGDWPDDLLVQHSSYEGKQSYSDQKRFAFRGSGVYARALAETLTEMYKSTDLLGMLTKVSEIVQEETLSFKSKKVKQCPVISDNLRYKVFLKYC